MGNPMLYIDPLGLDTAQVYGYIYNGDGLFKAQSSYEFLKNKAKRDSDFSEAFNSTNSSGSNKRPLTPEKLLAKRKAEEDRLRRIEYDPKRHNYGKEIKNASLISAVEKNYNGVTGIATSVVKGYDEIPNNLKRKVAYNLAKNINVKSGVIFQKAKGFANYSGKGLSKLGNVGNVLTIGMIGEDIFDDGKIKASSIVSGTLLVVGFAFPVTAIGIVGYGVLDYTFDLGDKWDKLGTINTHLYD